MKVSRTFRLSSYAAAALLLMSLCAPARAQEGNYREKYDELIKEYEALKSDRNNVLVQTKKLLEEKSAILDQTAEIEKLKSEKSAAIAEKDAVTAEKRIVLKKNAALEDKIKALDAKIGGLEAAKNDNAEPLEVIEEPKGAGSADKKDMNTLARELRDLRKELDASLRANDILKAKLDGSIASNESFKKDISDAGRKNRMLEKEVKNLPKKFAEIGRQNKILMKDAAKTHYNLGVFYIKSKEYNRAMLELERAIEIDPEDPQAYFNLGYIYSEYLVKRDKAVENFRQYLRYAKGNDKDMDWVKKYLLTWETYNADVPME